MLRVTYIYIILFVFISPNLKGQSSFISKNLQEIYDKLPTECKTKEFKDGDLIPCKISNSSLPLKIQYNSLGQISHIGVKLFDFEDNLLYPASMLAFIERYALSIFLSNDINSLNKKNAESRLYMNINGENIVFLNSKNLVQLRNFFAEKNISSKINFTDNYYTVDLKKDKNIIQIILPAEYDLISGLDKEEYGKQIEQQLTMYSASQKNTIEKRKIKELKIFDDILYFNEKDEYMPGILGDTYYKCDTGDDCIPVFDKNYVFESIRNSFLLPITKDKIKVRVNQRLYGNKSIEYVVSLNDLVSYFQRDHELYFGFESDDLTEVSGTLIISNNNLNYINLLHVKFEKDMLFSNDEVLINAKLYTNIPTSNVKNLFADFK